MFRVYFVSEMAQVELEKWTSVSPWYTGGSVERPSYHDVGAGNTGHREAVQILYDPTRQGGY